MGMTNWKKILKLINERSIGDLITRKELITLIYNPRYTGIQHGVDTSRILLTKVGVLEIKDRGIYIKRKNIKPTWSMFKLHRMSKTWQGWFMELD